MPVRESDEPDGPPSAVPRLSSEMISGPIGDHRALLRRRRRRGTEQPDQQSTEHRNEACSSWGPSWAARRFGIPKSGVGDAVRRAAYEQVPCEGAAVRGEEIRGCA